MNGTFFGRKSSHVGAARHLVWSENRWGIHQPQQEEQEPAKLAMHRFVP